MAFFLVLACKPSFVLYQYQKCYWGAMPYLRAFGILRYGNFDITHRRIGSALASLALVALPIWPYRPASPWPLRRIALAIAPHRLGHCAASAASLRIGRYVGPDITPTPWGPVRILPSRPSRGVGGQGAPR